MTLLISVIQGQIAGAHDVTPGREVLGVVGFDQRLEAQTPLELEFRDEEGKLVQLRRYFGAEAGDKPVVLALTYFACDNLCPLVRDGLATSLRQLSFRPGEEFEVVVVSIDPQETAEQAAVAKAQTLAAYGDATQDTGSGTESAAGWHFLTGDHAAIDRLADAIGFRYAYDIDQDEYAHPSGIVLLTPSGRIARYFYGIDYAPQDVRLGLVEASANRIGTAVDQLLLLCYHYDPVAGKYSPLILTMVRAAGLATVVGLGALVLILRRKNPQQGS
jgi:protein SCO1/2